MAPAAASQDLLDGGCQADTTPGLEIASGRDEPREPVAAQLDSALCKSLIPRKNRFRSVIALGKKLLQVIKQVELVMPHKKDSACRLGTLPRRNLQRENSL